MNKKIGVIALALCISAVSFVSAQNVDNKVIGFETSVVYGYNLNTQDVGNSTAVGINLTLSDNIAAGISYIPAGTNVLAASLLSLSYGIQDKAGATLSFGKDSSNNLVGIGMYYNIFEKKEPLSSTLKVKVDYLFAPATGMDQGDLRIALALGVGI